LGEDNKAVLMKDGFLDLTKTNLKEHYLFYGDYSFYYSPESGILYSLNMIFSPPQMRKLIQIDEEESRGNISLYINQCTKNLLVMDKTKIWPVFILNVPTERKIDVPAFDQPELFDLYTK
jgi:hypothetical protein